MTSTRFFISTDLDGTLLDHHDYSWEAAAPALSLCREQGVPVILNTSKTQVEAESLRDELGLMAPVIVENGSALLIPLASLASNLANQEIVGRAEVDIQKGRQNLAVIFGVERLNIIRFIEGIRSQQSWKFEGFNDWTVDEIADRTGLSQNAASAAAEKCYSEPFVWQDSESNLLDFERLAQLAGLRLMKGGRFYHLQGQTDKAKPLAWLKEHTSLVFQAPNGNSQAKLICLGDNHNDVAMLNFADIPVCVRSPVADFPSLSNQNQVIHTELEGPSGWNEAVQSILSGNREQP